MDNFYELFLSGKLNWTGKELISACIFLTVCAVVLFVLLSRVKIKLHQAIAGFLLAVFFCLLFSYCVFSRASGSEPRYNLELFWSWRWILAGNTRTLAEVLLNVVLLVPVGVSLPILMNKKKAWWTGLLIGLGVSVCIEVMQLVTRRGLFEWDDMIHNSIGCMVGTFVGNGFVKYLAKRQ